MADIDFDSQFYRQYYKDLNAYDENDALQHWFRHGKEEGRFANAADVLVRHANFNAVPPDFRPIEYIFCNPDLVPDHANWFDATLHYLNYGIIEKRTYKTPEYDPGFADYAARAGLDVQVGPFVNRSTDPRLQWTLPSITHWLRLKGLLAERFLPSFDFDFYASVNQLRDRQFTGQAGKQFLCLVHFGEAGVGSFKAIAESLAFDPDFYREYVLRGASEQSDVELYKSWLNEFPVDRRPPNQRRWLKDRFGVELSNSGAFDIATYGFANADLASKTPHDLLEHIFSDGIIEQRSSIRISKKNVLFIKQLADHLAERGNAAAAELLYKRCVHFVPDFAELNQHLGDLFLRSSRFAEAAESYERNVTRGIGSKWTFINLAACFEKLGDLEGAHRMMRAACEAYADDQGLIIRSRLIAERFFNDEFSYARAEARSGKIRDAQARLYEAALKIDATPVSFAPIRPIKAVALFANMDIFQCSLYRVEQKAEQLLAAGVEVHIYDWVKDRERFLQDHQAFQAVIFYRVAAFPAIIEAINMSRSAGIAVFYDIDDLVFDEDEFPEPFDDYAGQISQSDYVDLSMGVPLFRYALGLCDYAIASTSALAARMQPHVRERKSFVHPNALGKRHLSSMAAHGGSDPVGNAATTADRRKAQVVTLFYGSGTKAHKLDFENILLPALEELDRRFGKKITFVMAGYRPVSRTNAILDKTTFIPFTSNVEDYWAELSKSDINLSVLRNTPATGAKSEIKWLEAAMFGIPSVVSYTETHAEVIEDGVNGFLCATTADFIDKISLLICDKQLRHAVGEAARSKAQRDYGIESMSANIADILNSVVPVSRPRIRLLIVNVFYPPQSIGGATRVVYDNVSDIRELYPDEFEIEVFTTLQGGTDPYSVQVSSFDNVRVTALVAANANDVDFAPIDERAGTLFSVFLDRFKPDVIHFHCIQRLSAAVVEAALRRNIPYFITAHDGWWICDKQFLYDHEHGAVEPYDFSSPLRVRSQRGGMSYDRPLKLLPALRGAVAILSVSERFALVLRRSGLDNIRVVANGLPRVSRGDRAATSASTNAPIEPKTPSDRIVVAHIGGTEAHKGYQLFKYAIFAAEARNITVLIVDHALQPGEERYDTWGHTPVRFIAKRPQAEVAGLYAEIDVLFAPSLWQESFGLVTREALWAGCWVVASDRGAIGEPITEGVNGHIVSVDSIDGLVTVVRAIGADPGRYKTRVAPVLEMRTSQDQARDLVHLYRDVVLSKDVS